MELFFISGAVGFAIGLSTFVLLKVFFASIRKRPTQLDVVTTVEKFRSVGELVVFRVITKEIITTSDHWFGELGKKYFRWLASEKKMAMIFEFNIDFKYDLNSPDFGIELLENNIYLVKMPQCVYESHIKDISFYDEQRARLLPWLLPELLSNAFSNGLNEETKNRLVAEAKNQASKMASDLVKKMLPEVQKSAKQTLSLLAKGFGVAKVEFLFSDLKPAQGPVGYESHSEDGKKVQN